MLVPKMFLQAALKFVLPEVIKLIQPLQEYKDFPNDTDIEVERHGKQISDLKSRLHEVQELAHPKKDWTNEIASLAHTVQEELRKNTQEMKEYQMSINKEIEKLSSRMEDYEPRNIKLEALMDKFDRDVSYMDHNLKLIKEALTFKDKDA